MYALCLKFDIKMSEKLRQNEMNENQKLGSNGKCAQIPYQVKADG